MRIAVSGLACGAMLLVPQMGTAQGVGVEPELVGPGVVSTAGQETFPAVDPVDGSIWFSTYDESFAEQTIMVARRAGEGWHAPQVAPFSGEWGDRAPRFSPDGGAMYYTSNRPRVAGGSAGDLNLWRVSRSAAGWSEPEMLPPPVSSDANDMHAAVTDDAIWFASYRDGSLGRADVYRVEPGGRVDHLPAPVNDAGGQPDLWVSPDEAWMILVITEHPDGYGGDDLFLSRFEDGAWSTPVNLGPGVNTPEYEYGPTVSADGVWLYFTSHRGGSGDVYRVPVSAVLGNGG